MEASRLSSEHRRKRLLFRSWHRGTREMDLLLGNFAQRNLETFSDRQLDLFETLLEYADSDIYEWMTGRVPVPPALDNDVIKLLLNYQYRP